MSADRTLAEWPDADLVRRAREGRTEAFEFLVRRHQAKVVSLAYRLLGNIEDARDVGQEAFVRAYTNLTQLQDPSRFAPWLLRAVSNLALNFRKARSRRTGSSLDGIEADAEPARWLRPGKEAASGGPAESGALPEELREAISQALESLPERQRLALVLFSVEGVPQKDVAEILDCSVELVKWNVFQARRKMTELLAAYL